MSKSISGGQFGWYSLLVRAGSVALFVFAASFAQSDEAFEDSIDFRSTLAAESTLKIALGSWTDAERQFVVQMIDEIHRYAPGLFARATQSGSIKLYRTAEDSPSHPASAWARRRQENSLIFRDDFFRTGRPNQLGVEYSYWLLIHEVAHLADPVDSIGQSSDWTNVIEPRIRAVEDYFAADGKSLRDAMFAFLDKPAISRGLPSVYAAISLHEALAETTAAMYFNTTFEPPDELKAVLIARLFSRPTAQDINNSTRYREAYVYFRNKRYLRAVQTLNKALDRDPEFTMGYYLRGFVNSNWGRFEKAKADWTRGLELAPESAVSVTGEMRDGIEFLNEKLGE